MFISRCDLSSFQVRFVRGSDKERARIDLLDGQNLFFQIVRLELYVNFLRTFMFREGGTQGGGVPLTQERRGVPITQGCRVSIFYIAKVLYNFDRYEKLILL